MIETVTFQNFKALRELSMPLDDHPEFERWRELMRPARATRLPRATLCLFEARP
jgi:hypothetical protein